MVSPYYDKHGITIYHGDCLEIMNEMPENSIDMVFTDPPYSKEYIPLYWQSAREVSRILKQDRTATYYFSDYWLGEIFPRMLEHLDYYFVFHLLFLHSAGHIFPRKIEMLAKNIIVFQKGKFKPKEWIKNVLKTTPMKKHRSDRWEQSIEDALIFINHFSKEGEVVLDPFLGSGTALVACRRLNRKGIGIEINKEECDTAIQRVECTTPNFI